MPESWAQRGDELVQVTQHRGVPAPRHSSSAADPENHRGGLAGDSAAAASEALEGTQQREQDASSVAIGATARGLSLEDEVSESRRGNLSRGYQCGRPAWSPHYTASGEGPRGSLTGAATEHPACPLVRVQEALRYRPPRPQDPHNAPCEMAASVAAPSPRWKPAAWRNDQAPAGVRGTGR